MSGAGCPPPGRWSPSPASTTPNRPGHVEMADSAQARIARYAWGDDYHDVMGGRLADLAGWMRDTAGPGFDARWSVDDGPVQEKVYAARAGIGWIGKNTCVINPGIGSWILLGMLVTNVDLDPDDEAVDLCGTCRLCVDACPAGAFAEGYVLDARRCLSYLTIEIRGGIPAEQRPDLGAHIFGCDICQDVCPYNAVAPLATDACWLPRADFADARIASPLGAGRLGARAGHRGHRAPPRRRARAPPEPRRRHRQRGPAIDVCPRCGSGAWLHSCGDRAGRCAAVSPGSDGGRAHQLGQARTPVTTSGLHSILMAGSHSCANPIDLGVGSFYPWTTKGGPLMPGITAWEDDPHSSSDAEPVGRPVPDLGHPGLGLSMVGRQPAARVYPAGTQGFRVPGTPPTRWPVPWGSGAASCPAPPGGTAGGRSSSISTRAKI